MLLLGDLSFFFFFFSWCEVTRKCGSVSNEYSDDYIFPHKHCVCFPVFSDRPRAAGDSVFPVEHSVYLQCTRVKAIGCKNSISFNQPYYCHSSRHQYYPCFRQVNGIHGQVGSLIITFYVIMYRTFDSF